MLKNICHNYRLQTIMLLQIKSSQAGLKIHKNNMSGLSRNKIMIRNMTDVNITIHIFAIPNFYSYSVFFSRMNVYMKGSPNPRSNTQFLFECFSILFSLVCFNLQKFSFCMEICPACVTLHNVYTNLRRIFG